MPIGLALFVNGRVDRVQRQQHLKRVSARIDERLAVVAHQFFPFADVDQGPGRLSLFRSQLELVGDAVGVIHAPFPQCGIRANFKEKAIQVIGMGWRMLVEGITLGS